MSESNVPAKGFLSYTRRDNESFARVVDELKSVLEGRFHAATGRELEIFLDRTSIGWGDDWRNRIRESVENATFFIPVITMRYFESDRCREELLAFHQYAQELGVEGLILPIVLTGAEQINENDPRELVRLIDRLNFRSIEEAWLAGYTSSEWLREIHWMVNALKLKLSEAEASLASIESEAASAVERGEDATPAEHDDADLTELTDTLEGLTPATQRVHRAIQDLGDAAAELNEGAPAGANAAQSRARAVKAAHDLARPALELSDSGSALESLTVAADGRLRAVIGELRTIDADMAQEQLNGLLLNISALDQLGEVIGQLDSLVQALRFASLSNVNLRRSLDPAIRGLQTIKNAINIVDSWKEI